MGMIGYRPFALMLLMRAVDLSYFYSCRHWPWAIMIYRTFLFSDLQVAFIQD